MEFYKSPNETSINTKTMTASYLWTYLISCRIKILYENLNKRVCQKSRYTLLFKYQSNCLNSKSALLQQLFL